MHATDTELAVPPQSEPEPYGMAKEYIELNDRWDDLGAYGVDEEVIMMFLDENCTGDLSLHHDVPGEGPWLNWYAMTDGTVCMEQIDTELINTDAKPSKGRGPTVKQSFDHELNASIVNTMKLLVEREKSNRREERETEIARRRRES